MQLKRDDLKNPCLDYIQHIIFSPEGATFAAGGAVYDNYDAVRESFLNGGLSEDELKSGLIDALNDLLEPVRQHFANDATAQRLLADVQAYKAKGRRRQRTDRRARRTGASIWSPRGRCRRTRIWCWRPSPEPNRRCRRPWTSWRSCALRQTMTSSRRGS